MKRAETRVVTKDFTYAVCETQDLVLAWKNGSDNEVPFDEEETDAEFKPGSCEYEMVKQILSLRCDVVSVNFHKQAVETERDELQIRFNHLNEMTCDSCNNGGRESLFVFHSMNGKRRRICPNCAYAFQKTVRMFTTK